MTGMDTVTMRGRTSHNITSPGIHSVIDQGYIENIPQTCRSGSLGLIESELGYGNLLKYCLCFTDKEW